MTYREPLPEECPPEEAEEVNTPRPVYRLVSSVPPTDGDFLSQRAKHPKARFSASECIARGVSVFSNLSDAEAQTKRPNLRHHIPFQVTLDAGAGRIQKTSSRSHYTWWPYDGYDILANCQPVHP